MAQKRLIKLDRKKTLIKILLQFLMKNGNKNISELIIHRFLKTIQKNYKKNSKNIIKLGICNTIRIVSFRVQKDKLSRKKKLKYIPYFLKKIQRTALTIKTILKASHQKMKEPIYIKIKNEFISAANNKGDFLVKRQDIYNTVYEKKNFAHYRWFS